jgi:hypothetical protein
VRDLALFDLGIDSKLRACDLVRLKVRDICHGDRVAARAKISISGLGAAMSPAWMHGSRRVSRNGHCQCPPKAVISASI